MEVKMLKLHISEIDTSQYISYDGYSMQREYGETPNGNPMGGRWVFRGKHKELIDFDQYRHDLASRNDIKLIGEVD